VQAEWDDSPFMSEIKAAKFGKINPMVHGLTLTIVLLFVFMIVWASVAELDEVVVGMGKVVPSQQVQIVQNFDGGILAEILVKEGDIVEAGQAIINVENSQASSSLRDNKWQEAVLKIQIARLQAEASGEQMQVFTKLLKTHTELISNEQNLLTAHRNELNSNIAIAEERVRQRKQELLELRAIKKQLGRQIKLAKAELDITLPLWKKGLTSQIEVIRLKRDLEELDGSYESTVLALPRVISTLDEAERLVKGYTTTFRAKVHGELNDKKAMLSSLTESLTAIEDQVTRTTVRSPVRGTVIRVRVNTIGQVIRSGMDLVEIMPLEDSLLIEAQISPADIAFLRPNLKTVVKFTSYDFSIYGGMTGKLEHISADAIVNEQGDSFYKIKVRTNNVYMGTKERPLPIIPGMVATVDIMTGKKSVLDYILKPILKAKNRAMRER
jgi:membrane fusion protein, adhesin transport system